MPDGSCKDFKNKLSLDISIRNIFRKTVILSTAGFLNLQSFVRAWRLKASLNLVLKFWEK